MTSRLIAKSVLLWCRQRQRNLFSKHSPADNRPHKCARARTHTDKRTYTNADVARLGCVCLFFIFFFLGGGVSYEKPEPTRTQTRNKMPHYEGLKDAAASRREENSKQNQRSKDRIITGRGGGGGLKINTPAPVYAIMHETENEKAWI